MFGANYMNDRQGYTPLNLYVGLPFPADVQQVQAAMFESPNNALISINAQTQDKAAAVFTQETYEITKGTRVTGGLRFTQEKKSFTGNEAADIPNGLTVVPPDPAASDSFVPVTVATAPTVEKTFNKPTWRFSLDQDFSDSTLGYVSYNRGFKSGAYNPTAIAPNSIPVNPEVLDAYEIGVKSELLEHRLRVNGAAFHYNYKDLQVQTVNGTTGGVTTQNAAKAVSNGGELDLSALVTQAFTLNAGVSVLHAKYEDYLNASVFIPCVTAPTTPGCVGPAGNAQGFRNESGANLLFSPKFTANLGADYRAQMPGDNSLKFSSQYYHNSGYDTEVGGRLHVPSYNLVNLAATFYTPHDHYFLRLWGENLTDSHHAAYLNGGTQADGIAYYRPITYGITVGGKL
jgi:iron complex outermembrane receptor protein